MTRLQHWLCVDYQKKYATEIWKYAMKSVECSFELWNNIDFFSYCSCCFCKMNDTLSVYESLIFGHQGIKNNETERYDQRMCILMIKDSCSKAVS